MSIGLRNQRAHLYAYSNVGGRWQETRYTRVPNPGAADGAWWTRKEPVSARESQIAEQQEHRVDVVFAFADEVPVGAAGLTTDGVIKHGGTFYKINGLKPARLAREIIVTAIEASDEVYSNIIEGIVAEASFNLQLAFAATATVTGGGGGGGGLFAPEFPAEFP